MTSPLKDQLRDDLTTAIKASDKLRSATLRMVLTAVTNEEKAQKDERVLSDDEVLVVLGREAKKRREAATAFADADRPEQAAKERSEGEVIDRYLPKQLTDEEIAALVSDALAAGGFTGRAHMGPAMKAAQAAVAGRAEGGRVAAQVRKQLAA